MSWWLMHEKNKREEKVQALRDYFKRFVDVQCTDHFELNKFCFLAWTKMMMIKLQKKTGWKHSANMELKFLCNVFK